MLVSNKMLRTGEPAPTSPIKIHARPAGRQQDEWAPSTRYRPAAPVAVLKTLGRRLLAAIALIGHTRAAQAEMARLGLARPESLPTALEGSPFP